MLANVRTAAPSAAEVDSTGYDRSPPVPRDVLARFGWTRIVWSGSLEPARLLPLLEELRVEDCAHSWSYLLRNRYLDETAFPCLINYEAVHRPTEFISYIGIRADGTSEVVAVATIAERVTRAFPFNGFPVIARCFVRRQFRGVGLYRYLLDHRLELCHALWGPDIKVIHLGSANDRVLRTAMNPSRASRFVPVGEEDLDVGGGGCRVTALCLFTPAFAARLESSLAGAITDLRRPTAWTLSLRRLIRNLVRVGFDSSGYTDLLDTVERAQTDTGGTLLKRCKPLGELLTLFRSIPLVRGPASQHSLQALQS